MNTMMISMIRCGDYIPLTIAVDITSCDILVGCLFQYEEVDLRDALKIEVEDELSTLMKSKLGFDKDNKSSSTGKATSEMASAAAAPASTADTIINSNHHQQKQQPQPQQPQPQQPQPYVQVSRSTARRERRARNRAAAAGQVSAAGGGSDRPVAALTREDIHRQMADMKRCGWYTAAFILLSYPHHPC